MSIVIGNSQTAVNAATGTSQAVNKPTSTVSGDLLILGISVYSGGGSAPMATLSGWNVLGPLASGSGLCKSNLFWKVAGGAEPTTYTGTASLSTAIALCVTRITGAGATPTLRVATAVDGATGSTTSPAMPSITGQLSTDMVCQFLLTSNSHTGAGVSVTPPSGYLEQFDTANAQTVPRSPSVEMSNLLNGTSGGTATASLSACWTIYSIAIDDPSAVATTSDPGLIVNYSAIHRASRW